MGRENLEGTPKYREEVGAAGLGGLVKVLPSFPLQPRPFAYGTKRIGSSMTDESDLMAPVHAYCSKMQVSFVF